MGAMLVRGHKSPAESPEDVCIKDNIFGLATLIKQKYVFTKRDAKRNLLSLFSV